MVVDMNYTIPKTEKSEIFDRVKPVLDAVQAIIKKAGPQGLPSGHLYAMLMGYMDLESYQSMIDIMVQAGGITLNNHVLRATA
jgi:hypothetical protein